MSNLLSYKNYNGTVEYSKEDNCLNGKVVGLRSHLTYAGDSIRELEAELRVLRKQLGEKDEVIDILKKSVGILSKP